MLNVITNNCTFTTYPSTAVWSILLTAHPSSPLINLRAHSLPGNHWIYSPGIQWLMIVHSCFLSIAPLSRSFLSIYKIWRLIIILLPLLLDTPCQEISAIYLYDPSTDFLPPSIHVHSHSMLLKDEGGQLPVPGTTTFPTTAFKNIMAEEQEGHFSSRSQHLSVMDHSFIGHSTCSRRTTKYQRRSSSFIVVVDHSKGPF